MAESNDPAPAVAARPRPPRGRVLWVLAAIAAVLAGRGFGWFGGGGAPAAPPDGAPDAAAPEPTPRDAMPPDAAPRPEANGSAPTAATPPAAAAVPPAPASEPAASQAASGDPARRAPDGAASRSSDTAAPPPPDAERRGVDRDRLHALLSVVTAQREQGRLGAAFAALERATALGLDAEQHAAVRSAAEGTRAELDATCARIAGQLAEGEVLAARAAVEQLRADGPDFVTPALAAQLGLRADRLDHVPERTELPWPVAAPLPRDRAVRAWFDGELVTGRVAASRSDQITLRLETGAGLTYPTVPAAACEPVDATAAEAVECALAALHAGDVVLARLWERCAVLRGDGGSSPRAQQLHALLQ